MPNITPIVAVWSCVLFLLPVALQAAEQSTRFMRPVAESKNKAPSQTPAPTTSPSGEKDGTRKRGRHHHHGYHHRLSETAVVLPSGFVPITFAGEVYYYSQGTFYQLAGQDLFVSPAPVGAIVPAIPTSRERVEVEGRYYSVVNGIYYQIVPNGYCVVLPPVADPGPVESK